MRPIELIFNFMVHRGSPKLEMGCFSKSPEKIPKKSINQSIKALFEIAFR